MKVPEAHKFVGEVSGLCARSAKQPGAHGLSRRVRVLFRERLRLALGGWFGGWFRFAGVGRIDPGAGGDFLDIGRGVGVDESHGPGETAGQHVLKEGIGPDILAMAHAGVEDPAFALIPGPGGGIGRALILDALHGGRVLEQEDVHILPEVLQGIPFLMQVKAGPQFFHAREFRVDHRIFCHLLGPMFDELRPQQADVAVRFGTVVQVAVRSLFGFIGSMEGIGGGVGTREGPPVLHIIQHL